MIRYPMSNAPGQALASEVLCSPSGAWATLPVAKNPMTFFPVGVTTNSVATSIGSPHPLTIAPNAADMRGCMLAAHDAGTFGQVADRGPPGYELPPLKKKRKYKPRVRKSPVPFLQRLAQMFQV